MNNRSTLSVSLSLSLLGLSLLASSALTGCSKVPYRIDIDQGNIIEAQTLSRLRVGMRKAQVQQLLGSSLLQDVFHSNRWDYIQRYKQGDTQKVTESKVSLFFTNGLLARIVRDDFQVIETAPLPYSVTQ